MANFEETDRMALQAGHTPRRRTVVCLCGSTKFWRLFQRAGLEETMRGNIVLSIGAASGTDDDHFGNLAPEEYNRIKNDLDTLHYDKIAMADEILVLDDLRDGRPYIGTSTAAEIVFASRLGKGIRYWSNEHRPPAGYLTPTEAAELMTERAKAGMTVAEQLAAGPVMPAPAALGLKVDNLGGLTDKLTGKPITTAEAVSRIETWHKNNPDAAAKLKNVAMPDGTTADLFAVRPDPVPAARLVAGLYDFGDDGRTFIVSSELPGRTGKLTYTSKLVAAERVREIVNDYLKLSKLEIVAQLTVNRSDHCFEINGLVGEYRDGAIYASGRYNPRALDACQDLVKALARWLDNETMDPAYGDALTSSFNDATDKPEVDDGRLLLLALYQNPPADGGYTIGGSMAVKGGKKINDSYMAAVAIKVMADHFEKNAQHYPDPNGRVDMPAEPADEPEAKLVFSLYRWPDDRDGAYYSLRAGSGVTTMGKLSTVRPEIWKMLDAENRNIDPDSTAIDKKT